MLSCKTEPAEINVYECLLEQALRNQTYDDNDDDIVASVDPYGFETSAVAEKKQQPQSLSKKDLGAMDNKLR